MTDVLASTTRSLWVTRRLFAEGDTQESMSNGTLIPVITYTLGVPLTNPIGENSKQELFHFWPPLGHFVSLCVVKKMR